MLRNEADPRTGWGFRAKLERHAHIELKDGVRWVRKVPAFDSRSVRVDQRVRAALQKTEKGSQQPRKYFTGCHQIWDYSE